MNNKLVPVLCLLAAAGIQANLPHSIFVYGTGPNLVLVALIAFSLAADVNMGLFLGFVGGLIEGSMVGMSLGSYIATRTIVGFLAGISTTTFFSANPLVSILSAFWLTLISEILFVIANPVSSLLEAGRTIAIQCIWNAVLSFVVVLLFNYFATRRKIRIANSRQWH